MINLLAGHEIENMICVSLIGLHTIFTDACSAYPQTMARVMRVCETGN